MKKKILSIALALCLTFEMVPAGTALAADKEETVVEPNEVNTESQESEKSNQSAEGEIQKEIKEEISEQEDLNTASKEEEPEKNDVQEEFTGTNSEESQRTESEEKQEGTKEVKQEAESEEILDPDVIAERDKEILTENLAEVEMTSSLLTDPYGDISDFEVYQANYFLQFAGYDYLTEEYDDPCSMLVRNGRENGLSDSIAKWRRWTFNGASELEYTQAEVAYYEAIFFDLLYDAEGGGFENAVYDNVIEGSKAIKASAWKQIVKAGDEVLMNTELSADNMSLVWNAVQKCESLEGILKKVGTGTDILGYVDSGKELIEKLAELETITSLSEDMVDIIEDMAQSYNKIDTMNAALEEFTLIYTAPMSSEWIGLYMADRLTIDELTKNMASTAWGAVVSSLGSAGIILEGGRTIGKLASNFLVSTDSIVENFYSMEAMSNFTELLKSLLITYAE